MVININSNYFDITSIIMVYIVHSTLIVLSLCVSCFHDFLLSVQQERRY